MMKKRNALFIVSLLTLLTCASSFAEQKGAKANGKREEAAVTDGDYTYFQRDEFLKYSKREIAKMKNELANLEIKAKQKTGLAQEEAQKKLDELKLSVEQLNEKVKKVKGARKSEWDELQTSFNNSMDNVKYSIRKSRQWLSEKIAP